MHAHVHDAAPCPVVCPFLNMLDICIPGTHTRGVMKNCACWRACPVKLLSVKDTAQRVNIECLRMNRHLKCLLMASKIRSLNLCRVATRTAVTDSGTGAHRAYRRKAHAPVSGACRARSLPYIYFAAHTAAPHRKHVVLCDNPPPSCVTLLLCFAPNNGTGS